MIGPEARFAWPKSTNTGVNYDFYGVGAGPALGMNFNRSDKVSFTVNAGYQRMKYEETGPSTYTVMREDLIYMTIGILFRSTEDIF